MSNIDAILATEVDGHLDLSQISDYNRLQILTNPYEQDEVVRLYSLFQVLAANTTITSLSLPEIALDDLWDVNQIIRRLETLLSRNDTLQEMSLDLFYFSGRISRHISIGSSSGFIFVHAENADNAIPGEYEHTPFYQTGYYHFFNRTDAPDLPPPYPIVDPLATDDMDDATELASQPVLFTYDFHDDEGSPHPECQEDFSREELSISPFPT